MDYSTHISDMNASFFLKNHHDYICSISFFKKNISKSKISKLTNFMAANCIHCYASLDNDKGNQISCFRVYAHHLCI